MRIEESNYRCLYFKVDKSDFDFRITNKSKTKRFEGYQNTKRKLIGLTGYTAC